MVCLFVTLFCYKCYNFTFFLTGASAENGYDHGVDTLYNIQRMITMGAPDDLKDLKNKVKVLLDNIKYLLSYNKEFYFFGSS